MTPPLLLHHRVQGSGPAVLLLHAGVCDLRMWQPQWEALTAAHRVIGCDLRGYGQTPLPHQDYSDAQDVLHLLDHLAVDEFAMVGASYGGHVALQVATAAPGRVNRLVLLCAAADLVQPTADIEDFVAQEDALLDAEDVTGATELNVRTWLGADADEANVALVREMQRNAFAVQLAAGDVESEDGEVDLTRITMPTTVVSGLQDLDYFVSTAQELAASIPAARLVELDWAAHLPSLERPEMMARLLLDALAERPGPAQTDLS